jgi:hypothetical protein
VRNPTSVNSALLALLVKEHMLCMNEVTLVIVVNPIKIINEFLNIIEFIRYFHEFCNYESSSFFNKD